MLYQLRFIAVVAILMLAACGQPPQPTTDSGRPAQEAMPELSISGKVTLLNRIDATGIQVFVPGTSLLAFTDEVGQFRIDNLKPGSYTVRAQTEGYNAIELGRLEISPDSSDPNYMLSAAVLTPTTTTVAVQQAVNLGQINGRVSLELPDALGNLDRCVIELEDTLFRTVCDAQGNFHLWNVPADNYTLVASMPGTMGAQVPVRVLPDTTSNDILIQLPVDPAFISREIRGLVRMSGADGNFLTDFDKVVVTLRKPDNNQATVSLNNDGTFRFGSLQPGLYFLSASAAGFVDSPVVEIDLEELPESDVQLSLKSMERQAAEQSGMVRGIAVKNSTEEDSGGIRVGLAGTSHVSLTGMDGSYRLESVAPGEYTLIATADGFEPVQVGPFEIKPGDELEVDGIILDPKLDRPKVLSVSPQDGSRDVVVRNQIPITVRFSKKMDPDSLRDAISIQPEVDYEIQTGREQQDTDFDMARIMLAGSGEGELARFNTRYTVRIAETAADMEGVTLKEGFEASFETGKASVIGSRPANGGTLSGIGVRESLIVYFNAPIDPESISGSDLRIRPRLDADPQVSMDLDPGSGWTRMYVRANWQPDTEYMLSIGRRTRTTSRESLSNTPYAIEFKTPEARPYNQPTAPESVR